MYGPLNCAGNGSKGFDARTEEYAARSSGSFPELAWISGSLDGTVPSRMILNVSTTMPFSPSSTDAGMTANQLRFTVT